MKRVAIALLGFCLLGCEQLHTLFVSRDFTPDEQEIIAEAVWLWGADVRNDVVLDYGTWDGKSGYIHPSMECDPDVLGFTTLSPNREPEIHICLSATDSVNQFKRAVLHELGHALAARNSHLDGKHVMVDWVDRSIPTTPTDADYDYVRARRKPKKQ